MKKNLVFALTIIITGFIRHSLGLTCNDKDSDCLCQPRISPETVLCQDKELNFIPNDLPPTTKLLDLSNNRIHQIDTSISSYTALTELKVDHNLISSIQPGSFYRLEKLRILDISSNHLSSLSRFTFKGLERLTELNLADNNLDKLDEYVFSFLTATTSINLAGNRLKQIDPQLFKMNVNLEYLDLSDNNLEYLGDRGFASLGSLSVLHLQNNEIKDLSYKTFQTLTSLTELNLSHCGIKNLASNIFQALHNLKALDLSNNELQIFPNQSLSMLSRLQTLIISENHFSEIGSLKGLGSLQEFVMEGCPTTVNEFHLRPDAFTHNTVLQTINITKCRGLNQIPALIFMNLPSLKVLNLRSNGIRHLGEKSADWSRIDYFDITLNPLDCTCPSLNWLSAILDENGRIEAAKCETPLSLAGISLRELQLECSRKEKSHIVKLIFIIVCSLLITAVLIVSVCFAYRRFHSEDETARREHRRRFSKLLKKNVQKNDIQMVPKVIENSSKYIDVIKEEDHLYEELPVNETLSTNFPDIKITEI